MEKAVKVQISADGKHRISIYQDECPTCPCTDWDLAAKFIFESGRSGLSTCCNWADLFSSPNHDIDDAARELVRDHVATERIIKYVNDNLSDFICSLEEDGSYSVQGLMWGEWVNHFFIDVEDVKSDNTPDELLALLESEDCISLLADSDDIVAKEISFVGYSQGDYVSGIAYCTKEWYAKNVDKEVGEDWKSKAEKYIDDDKEVINRWMWGDVYGYILEERVGFTKTYEDGRVEPDEEWNEIDSCWDYFEEPDDIIKEFLPESSAA